MKFNGRITKEGYLDEVRELALKDVEIVNLEKKIYNLTVKNIDILYDDILESLGEMYYKLDLLKQERETLKNNLSKIQNAFCSF